VNLKILKRRFYLVSNSILDEFMDCSIWNQCILPYFIFRDMMKLGSLIIHGMGKHNENFAEPLIIKIRNKLGSQSDEVLFQPCWWSPTFDLFQENIWVNLQQNDNMKALSWRKEIVFTLGHPVSYLSGFFQPDFPTYNEIHKVVKKSLKDLGSAMGEPFNKPLIVLAHSLGSIIISNYIWDIQQRGAIGLNSYEGLQTLTKLITYGSTIPLFLPQRRPVKCISFPSVNSHQN
jgi:hypothetical protein